MSIINLKKDREQFFPDIEDWTDPQEERKNKHPKEQTVSEFYFFSKDCYKLIHYGIPSYLIAMGAGLGLWAYLTNHPNLAIIPGLMGVFGVYLLIKRIREYPRIKNLTFYDIFLRDDDYGAVDPNKKVKK